MVKRVHYIAAIVVVVIVAGLVFVTFGTDTFAAKSNNDTIYASVPKDCSATPWVVGEKKGFFEKYGINLVDKGQISEQAEPAAFASGQINVIDNHPDVIINLLQSGAKLSVVAVGGAEPLNNTNADHMHYLISQNSSYQNISDIKTAASQGKKIKVGVVATGTCADLEFNAWLRSNGLNKSSVTYVVMTDPEQEQALKQGEIDVASLHPPFYKKAESDGGVNILTTSYDAFGKAAGMTLIAFPPEFIQKYPGTVKDFINAYKDSERWSNSNRDEAGNLTADFIGLPYTSNVHWYSDNGGFDDTAKQYLQQWIDAMVTDGDIPAGKYTPDNLISSQFSDTWKTNLPDN